MPRLLFVLFAAMLVCPPIVAEDISRPHLSQDAQVNDARRLIESARYRDALLILRPLAKPGRPDITDIRFLTGLAAMGAAASSPPEQKTRLLDEAISAFHAILTGNPELTRVRLELARAFFTKAEDGLAKEHFERVLAGNPPPPMAANIRRFLHAMRARKRWSGYLSVNAEHDNNINSGADRDTVYLFGLPFRFNESSLPRAETGISFSGGGEYQHDIAEKWRWRFGADAVRGEYRGHELDQTYLSFRTGPRWLVSRQSEADMQVFFGQRWAAKKRFNKEFGLRFNGRRQIGKKLGINGRWAWKQTTPRNNAKEVITDAEYSLNGNYLFTPLIQFNAGIRGGESRPNNGGRFHERGASAGFGVILPKGWTFGGNAQWSRARYKQNAAFTANRRIDRGRTFQIFVLNRSIAIFGFSPQIGIIRERQISNSATDNYRRTRWNFNFVRQF
ncbi:MAG: surface lipoprotein assembly modifier [Gammaproteobacteria bacterium]